MLSLQDCEFSENALWRPCNLELVIPHAGFYWDQSQVRTPPMYSITQLSTRDRIPHFMHSAIPSLTGPHTSRCICATAITHPLLFHSGSETIAHGLDSSVMCLFEITHVVLTDSILRCTLVTATPRQISPVGLMLEFYWCSRYAAKYLAHRSFWGFGIIHFEGVVRCLEQFWNALFLTYIPRSRSKLNKPIKKDQS